MQELKTVMSHLKALAQRLDAECDFICATARVTAECDFDCATASCRVRLWFAQQQELLPSATLSAQQLVPSATLVKTRQNRTSRTGQVIIYLVVRANGQTRLVCIQLFQNKHI